MMITPQQRREAEWFCALGFELPCVRIHHVDMGDEDRYLRIYELWLHNTHLITFGRHEDARACRDLLDEAIERSLG